MQSFQGKGGRLKLSSYLQPFIPKNPVFYQKKRRKLLNKQHISLENLTFTHSLVMFICVCFKFLMLQFGDIL